MPVASKGRIHDVFDRNLTQLTEQAEHQARAARGDGPRPWNRPEEVPGVIDVPGITAAFDRTEIGSNYAACVADGGSPGTGGDVVALKTQNDYTGVMERAFRARHCTPVRAIALATGWRKGHGSANGIFGGVRRYAQDALKAGQA
jgi:hypothetical protein